MRQHAYRSMLLWEFLTQAAIAAYLTSRVPDNSFSPRLAGVMYQHADGNPLFMVRQTVVDHLVRREQIAHVHGQWMLSHTVEHEDIEIPASLKCTIERQIDDLSTIEQRILEVASIVQTEFSSAAVATALAINVEEVETSRNTLGRQGRCLQSSEITDGPDGATAYNRGQLSATDSS